MLRRKMRVFARVYQAVRKIPAGKVTTYGAIAKLVGTAPCVVGYALHANKNRKVPCHRVVDRKGRLAPNFAPPTGGGGAKEQYLRLQAEGTTFTGHTHVDLSRHYHAPL